MARSLSLFLLLLAMLSGCTQLDPDALTVGATTVELTPQQRAAVESAVLEISASSDSATFSQVSAVHASSYTLVCGYVTSFENATGSLFVAQLDAAGNVVMASVARDPESTQAHRRMCTENGVPALS